MQAILAWAIVIVTLIAAYPWAATLLARDSQGQNDTSLALLLAPPMSAGAVTLIMFWEALLGIPLTLPGISLPYFALAAVGAWRWWQHRPRWPVLHLPQSRLAWIALTIMALICAGILFNSVYWPFSRDDAVAIYHHFATLMADSGRLAPLPGDQTLYEAYPILMSLNYGYSYLAAGWHNEFLARLLPALLSIICLGVVYHLGKTMHSAAAGWLAVLLLALTPNFVSWASSGYVDLPMACYYGLAAIFAWRLRQSHHWRDALLCGLMLAFAAWTKNAALVALPLVFLWFLWSRLPWRLIALTFVVCGLVVGPWYLRNLLDAGLIVPPTAWTEQAQRTLETALVFLSRPQNYALTGPLILIAVASALLTVIRRRFDAPALVLLLLWTVPFFAVWWLLVSYDPRFVLLFLPLLCVLTGIQLANFWAQVPQQWHRLLLIPALVAALILAALLLWDSVEYKGEILRQPLMSADERRAIVYADRQPRLYRELYGAD